MDWRDQIGSDPELLGGRPVVRGPRGHELVLLGAQLRRSVPHGAAEMLTVR